MTCFTKSCLSSFVCGLFLCALNVRANGIAHDINVCYYSETGKMCCYGIPFLELPLADQDGFIHIPGVDYCIYEKYENAESETSTRQDEGLSTETD